MRLICLNIWGGTLPKKLLQFIEIKSKNVDIFCFQEVYESEVNRITPTGYKSNILKDISTILPDYNYHFAPQFHGRDFHKTVDYPISQGIAMFWSKKLNSKEKGDIFTFNKENEIILIPNTDDIIPPRNFQFVIFDNFLVINIHGYWAPSPKFDTPQRLKQSEMIIEFTKKYDFPKIITGDFNLGMETQSVRMFEDAGFRNLVRESKAKSTRSSLYDIKWRKNDKYADFIFTSKELPVFNFEVMKDEVSDHLPLMVEFDA